MYYCCSIYRQWLECPPNSTCVLHGRPGLLLVFLRYPHAIPIPTCVIRVFFSASRHRQLPGKSCAVRIHLTCTDKFNRSGSHQTGGGCLGGKRGTRSPEWSGEEPIQAHVQGNNHSSVGGVAASAPLECALAKGDKRLRLAPLAAGADGGAGWIGLNGRTLLGAAAAGGNHELVSAVLESRGLEDLDTASIVTTT